MNQPISGLYSTPVQATCERHGLPLLLTQQSPLGSRPILTCPQCSADVLDTVSGESIVIFNSHK